MLEHCLCVLSKHQRKPLVEIYEQSAGFDLPDLESNNLSGVFDHLPATIFSCSGISCVMQKCLVVKSHVLVIPESRGPSTPSRL